MDAEDASFSAILREAVEHLQNGSWKEPVKKAMDSRAAGDLNLKWTTYYSCLSSGLPQKFHTFADGKSQYGKSFIQKIVISDLFEGKYDFATDASGKAAYYEALAKNPGIYKNKILHMDEYNDLTQAAKNFIKSITTANTDRVKLKTVVDQKFIESELVGLPVLITNSMELSEDPGNQARNRFFIINVDETRDQSKCVEEFQIEEMIFGDQRDEGAIDLAKAISYCQLQKTDFKILNPFGRGYSQKEYGERNRLPMFNTLLSCITYANRFQRPCFIDKKKRNIILASLSDNVEALVIWRKNEWQQRLKIPERYRKIFEILPETQWRTKIEVSDMLRENGIVLSADSCYTYMHEMEKKDLLTSRKREDEDGRQTREVEFQRILDMSNISVLDFNFEDPGVLAETIKAIFKRCLISDTPSIEETSDKLLDYVLTKELKIDQLSLSDYYG